jgi:signal transduction histidine kinase
MQRVRNICDNLIPPDFQRRRFDDALRNLCYNFEQRTGIECQLVIQDNLPYGSFDGDTQLQSFRVVQECLSNIEKHAEASKTSVIVRSIKEGELVICVSDNGKGFSPPDRDSLRSDGGHYGLWNIFERAASIGAEVTIDSEAGEGTMVTLKIPFKLEDR